MNGCIRCHGPTDERGNCYICDAKEMKTSMTPTLNSLTDDQQTVLLAKAQDWTNILSHHSNKDFMEKYWNNVIAVGCAPDESQGRVQPTPSYLTDLNATIALCDMLGEKGWKSAHQFNNATKEWTWNFYKHHGPAIGMIEKSASHASLATAISHAALLALNLATK